MDCETGERFEAIAERAIGQALLVGRDLAEFAKGLKIMEGVLEIHRESFQSVEDEPT